MYSPSQSAVNNRSIAGAGDFGARIQDVAADSFDHVAVNQEAAQCEVELKVR
jgi:hypothetical protein